MDTKWRNYKKTKIARFILIILILASLSGTVFQFTKYVENHQNHMGIIFEKGYLNSNNYRYNRNDIYYKLRVLVGQYKNEEYIRSGKGITEQDVINYGNERYYEESFNEFMNSERYNYNISEIENFKYYKEYYPETVKKIKEEIIKEQVQEYNRIIKSLEEYKNIEYYATNGNEVYTNIKNKDIKAEEFKKYKGYLIEDYDNGLLTSENMDLYYGPEDMISDDTKIYIGFTDKYFDSLSDNWSVKKKSAIEDFKYLAANFFLTILFFIIYIGLLPSKEEEGKERLIDKLYTDIALVSAMTLITFYLVIISENMYIYGDIYTFNIFILSVTLVIGALGLFTVISMIRNIKNKRFFKHSLTYKIFAAIKGFFLRIYRANKPEKKAALLFILYTLFILITFPIFFITIPLGAYFLLRQMRNFTLIKEGVERVKEGELSYKIEIEKDGEFKDLAENINTISEGLDNAIDNELKSERLKAELITNVSHDIRTPLTSIITYIDLLKNEEDEEKRKEYLEILEAKSNRLKALTDDLFEASKVSSGSIPVNITKIDIVSLLTQGLGELNDRIEERELDFIVNNEFEEMNMRADGDLLWRAIENLLSNIFKYSLKGSRIYIDILKVDGGIEFTMKNISAYKLNISAEELMQRFKRGDESRTSEGSGLGLSIAESLIDLQGGEFKLEIDGDLFKTTIILPEYK